MSGEIFLLEQETGSFSFRVVGRSAQECRELMAAAWRKHCDQTGADPDWLGEAGDWTPIAITVPGVLRDGEPF